MSRNIYHYVHKETAVTDLQKCFNEISQLPSTSTIKYFSLEFHYVNITPPILALLIQVLNESLLRAPNDTEWNLDLSFEESTFGRPRTSTTPLVPGEDFCSPDDIQSLASALACRPFVLQLIESPEILESLLNSTPQLDSTGLFQLYCRQKRLSALDCARLGGLVQKCISLKGLFIGTNQLEEPLILGEVLANASHLQCVSFRGIVPHDPQLSDSLVRVGGDCLVGHLLNPQSKLQRLSLIHQGLEDRHFMAIVEMLPTSRLEELILHYNNIGRQGVLAFAHQLPRFKSLKKVDFALNAWDHLTWSPIYSECNAALLQGMLLNYSIECLNNSRKHARLNYLTRSNKIRRRILATSTSIPVGLWPLILERVGSSKGHRTMDEVSKFPAYRANALYVVLQNTPVLSFTRSAPSLRRSQRKRGKKVARYLHC